MRLYELFLDSLERDICLYSYKHVKAATFNNEGRTDGAVHSYRKLTLENEILFEKVYFKDEWEWKKTELFYRHVYTRLIQENIKVPALLRTSEGSDLLIAYTEYLNLESVDEEHYFEIATDMAACLAGIEFDIDSIPSNMISDFNAEPIFYTKNERLRKALYEKHPAMLELLDRVNYYLQRHPNKRITHGDLHRLNVFKNGKIIDWDHFGFYPIGYDFAFIVSRIDLSQKLLLENYLELEHQSYIKVIGLVSEEDFKVSMAYFTASFLWNASGINADLSLELLKLLKKRFEVI